MVVAKCFEMNARFNAKAEGVPDLSLAVLPVNSVPLPEKIEEMNLGEQVAERVIAELSKSSKASSSASEVVEKTLRFGGKSYAEATDNMEKHFLQHCWSDGLPLVPPTREAVDRMLEGTELPPDHVVGLVEPAGGKATVEKIAVNAVMAGCLPQYMPVILAAFEAMAEPLFDLRGIQCTTGMVSPLLIVSGPRLIQELNINDSFSTIGPGWRANATIGRAIRLIMINMGYAWPGKNDMKAFGSPFKYVMLMAENESGYGGFWDPLRVVEGFDRDQPTISLLPAVSWGVDHVPPNLATFDRIAEMIAKQGRAKYDRKARLWGKDNMVIISPEAFIPLRNEGITRSAAQKELYNRIQSTCADLYEGEQVSPRSGAVIMPDWIVQRCKQDLNNLVTMLSSPESLKIIVAGGSGSGKVAYIGSWGPASYFATKPIKLPQNWEGLLDKYKGWETPTVR